jgi:hypothetical protein
MYALGDLAGVLIHTRAARKMLETSSWIYILLAADDDTYFFMHNFRDFIARWDPNAVHFFGNTMKYKAGTNPHTGGPPSTSSVYQCSQACVPAPN